nr:unnamed protein product [Haemonchus contortus]
MGTWPMQVITEQADMGLERAIAVYNLVQRQCTHLNHPKVERKDVVNRQARTRIWKYHGIVQDKHTGRLLKGKHKTTDRSSSKIPMSCTLSATKLRNPHPSAGEKSRNGWLGKHKANRLATARGTKARIT